MSYPRNLEPIAQEKEVRAIAGRLKSVDREFVLLPVDEPRTAAAWILASFFSGPAIVPYPANLPAPALGMLQGQLPPGRWIMAGDIGSAPSADGDLAAKALSTVWAVVFSSGSSGTPKGVALSGGALRASALAHAAHSGVSGRWLLNLPLFHVGGLSVLTRAFFNQSEVSFASAKFSAEETLEKIRADRVAGLSLVPTTLKKLISLGEAPPASLRMILLGGSAPSAELLRESAEKGWPVLCTYGMTEHCSQIATETRPGSGKRPLPGVSLAIAADGEILVKSACLANGYYRNGECSALPLVDGYFPTGDIGELVDGGLRVTGRKSDLIISGGLNIFPSEVETVLQRAPGVKECAVVGAADPVWGEAVCAAVVTDNGSGSAEELRIFLRERIDGRKVPKHFVFVTALPRSGLGKIVRPELRRLIEKNLSRLPGK